MDEDLKVCGVVFVVGLVAALVLILSYAFDRPVCLASYSEYQPQWGFWSGCRIEWQGKLTPTRMIKNINLAQ